MHEALEFTSPDQDGQTWFAHGGRRATYIRNFLNVSARDVMERFVPLVLGENAGSGIHEVPVTEASPTHFPPGSSIGSSWQLVGDVAFSEASRITPAEWLGEWEQVEQEQFDDGVASASSSASSKSHKTNKFDDGVASASSSASSKSHKTNKMPITWHQAD